MPPPIQKAEFRPISFVLHNQVTGAPPTVVNLAIRPEDLTRTDPSRLTVHQTLGNAWADNFGRGLSTVTISGTTGWGQGYRPDGLQQFLLLHDTVFSRWHEERAAAIESGQDPDGVKLIFSDTLDEFTWVVAPQNFVLKRNKTRPLLAQYQITLTYLSGDVADVFDAVMADQPIIDMATEGRSALDQALVSIDGFANDVSGAVGTVLGPIQDAVAGFTALTARGLGAVQSVVGSGMKIVDSVAGPVLGMGINLTRAAANVTWAVQSVASFSPTVQAKFSRGAAAFNNANLIMQNAFKPRQFVPNYDSMFGSANGSSTSGGMPISKYNTENPFRSLYPLNASPVSASGPATQALRRLYSIDPVLLPPNQTQMGNDMRAVNSGVIFR